jgi:hypothetical protein
MLSDCAATVHRSCRLLRDSGRTLLGRTGAARGRLARSVILAAGVLASGPAWAESAPCFGGRGESPRIGLTGTLRQGHFLGPNRSPDGARTFYVLDLGSAICLDEAKGGPALSNVRSVHVDAADERRLALLDKYRNQRVAVRLSSLAPASEDYHRRPVIGAVESIVPEP